MIQKFTNLFANRLHAIGFTIIGAYVTGWPLASARWYIAYLVGLVLVWTLPSAFKKNQLLGYCVLILSFCAKAYFSYLTPTIDVQTIPISMYKGKFTQPHLNISEDFEKILHSEFAKDIDIHQINPKASVPVHSVTHVSSEPILYDFKVSYKWVDRSKIWALPIDVQSIFGEVPVVLSIHINDAHHGTLWPMGILFEKKTDNTIQIYPNKYNQGFDLKNHIGSTFFIPFVGKLKSENWVYIEVQSWSVYIPLFLLIAAVLLCNLNLFPNKAMVTIEQLICLGFAYLTICVSDVASHQYPLHNLSDWIHNNVWSGSAIEAPLWFGLHKIFYQVTYFGYLVPIACFWIAAWAFLQLLRQFTTPNQAYILWGLLLATPLLAKQGIGLHVYRPWYVAYSSLMLGMPLFLLGFLGYFKKFTHLHAIAWIMASLCSPALSIGICGLLLHKHIGKYRFIYLAICLGLYIAFTYNQLFSPELLNRIAQTYNTALIIVVLTVNIFMAFSKKLEWKRLARATLIMHGAFLFQGAIPSDAYLALTLSATCSAIYVLPHIPTLMKWAHK